MKYFRVFALVMAFLLIISAFSACGMKSSQTGSGDSFESAVLNGDGESTLSSSKSNSSIGEKTSSSVSDSASKHSSPEQKASSTLNNSILLPATSSNPGSEYVIDMKGAVITIAGIQPRSGYSTYDGDMAIVENLQKALNCKIQFKDTDPAKYADYYANFTTATMNGTKYADICVFPGSLAFPHAAANGYVRCLDHYFESQVWEMPQWIDALTNQSLLLNQKHYFAASNTHSYFEQGIVTWFNRELFKQFGVEDPYSLSQKKQWNWDTLCSTAKAMTRMSGGKQYYGIADIPILGTSNGADLVIGSSNGGRRLNVDSPAYLEAIRLGFDLYHTDKVIPQNGGVDRFVSGEAAMIFETMDAFAGTNAGMTYAPIGPKMNDYNYTNTDCLLFMIPATVKEKNVPNIALILLNYVYPYDWRQTTKEYFEEVYGDKQNAAIALDIHNRAAASGAVFPSRYSWVWQNIENTDYGIRSQQTPEKFASSVKETGQAEIDTLWAKVKRMK